MSGAAALVPVRTSLVIGASAGARERLIAAQLALGPFGAPGLADETGPTGLIGPARAAACVALLLEGLPDGSSSSSISPSPSVLIARIAPGCLCCTGNLVLRVTLNRLLRRRPERLYIALASTAHLDQLRSWLLQPPYDQLLELTPDLCP